MSVSADGVIENLRLNCSEQESKSVDERIAGAVLPGVANLHSHAHQRAMTGLAEQSSGEQDNFWSWRKVMYQMLERINPDQLYHIARMLYLEMLQAGYTHVAEFQYLHHMPNGNAYKNPAEMTLQCLRAARDVGIGFTALPVLYRYGGFGGQPSTEGQKRFTNDQDGFCRLWECVRDELIEEERIGVAPHSLRAISESLLKDVLSALPNDIPVHLHIAEQTTEVEDCVKWCGQRPMEWVLERFSVNADWCLIHATHLEESELTGFAQSGATAGLCPTTEANLGDGIFNAPMFLQAGGRFGIGSDSQISVSVTEELRWLEYVQRLLRRQRNVLNNSENNTGNNTDRNRKHCGTQLFQQAVTGGNKACGIAQGGISAGAQANFIVLDMAHPRLMERTRNELIDSWIFAADSSAIRAVYTKGYRTIENGKHADEIEIHRNFKIALQQLGDSQ